MNLENRLNKRGQSQQATYCMIPLIWNVQNRQIHRERKSVSDFLGEMGNGKWKVTANGYGISFGDNGNVLKLIVLLVAKSCEWSKTTELYILKELILGASLVEQWLRIRLPVQGTWVRALVREDPTCCGATKPVCHDYWARVPQLLKPAHLEPVLCNKRSHCNEKPVHCNQE